MATVFHSRKPRGNVRVVPSANADNVYFGDSKRDSGGDYGASNYGGGNAAPASNSAPAYSAPAVDTSSSVYDDDIPF